MSAMYCPRCAQSSSTEQKFCRHCGFSLQDVAPLLGETPSTAESDKLERHLKKVIGWALLSLLLWILLLASLDIPGLAPVLKNIIRYVGILSFGLGVILSLYAGTRWWWLWMYGAAANRLQPQPDKLEPQKQTAELTQTDLPEKALSDTYPEPVPSVTERTTELLLAERRDRVKEG